MAKSHTLLGCVTLLLTAAAPLAAQASLADNMDDTPTSAQHDGWFSPLKAVGALSGVALFTTLLKANDNSAAPSHNPVWSSNGPSMLGQTGSDNADNNDQGNDETGIHNQAATTPEPGTLVLVASGLVGLASVRRRKQA